MSVGAAPRPGEPDGVPLSDADWDTLAALQTELDLGSSGRGAPEGRFVAFICRLVVWLTWLLDPERRRRRRERLGTGRPAGG